MYKFSEEALKKTDVYKSAIGDQDVIYCKDIFESSKVNFTTFIVVTKKDGVYNLYRFWVIKTFEVSVDLVGGSDVDVIKHLGDCITNSLIE
jgi:hypothetical protein